MLLFQLKTFYTLLNKKYIKAQGNRHSIEKRENLFFYFSDGLITISRNRGAKIKFLGGVSSGSARTSGKPLVVDDSLMATTLDPPLNCFY